MPRKKKTQEKSTKEKVESIFKDYANFTKEKRRIEERLAHIEKYLYENDPNYVLSTLPKPTRIDNQVINVIKQEQQRLFETFDISEISMHYEKKYKTIRINYIYSFLTDFIQYEIIQNEKDICHINGPSKDIILSLCPTRKRIQNLIGIHHNTLKKSTDYLVTIDKILQIGSKGGVDPNIYFSSYDGMIGSDIAPWHIIYFITQKMKVKYKLNYGLKDKIFYPPNTDIPLQQWFFPRKGKQIERFEKRLL